MRRFSRLSPSDDSAAGLAWMRMAGFCPPEMLTSPTPDNCEIFCASRVSARSCTFVSGSVSLVKLSVRIGASAGLVLV